MVLGACRLGADLGPAWTVLSPDAWCRLAILAPLGLIVQRPITRYAVWLLVSLAALQSGAGFADRLEHTAAAVAPDRWQPSQPNEIAGAAVLRLGARPRSGRADRWSAPATILAWSGRDATGPPLVDVGATLHVRGRGAPPTAGALVAADLRLAPPSRATVFGGFDTAAWLAGHALDWSGRLEGDRAPVAIATGDLASMVGDYQRRAQRSLRARLDRGLPPRESAIAGAVLLGGGADRALRDPFARLGLAHLFALSGLHVGILAGLLLLALQPVGAAPLTRLMVLGVLLAGYVVLVDAPGSVVRAAGLVGLGLLAPVAGRRGDSLRTLGLLLWLNALWQPAALLDTGLRLSYLAAGGIVAGQRLLDPWRQAAPRRLRPLVAALGVTVAAQLATMPEIARSFGFVPLLGPLANLLLVPVFGIVVTLLAAGLVLSCVWPWAGQGLLACAWLGLRPLSAATALAAREGMGMEAGLPIWSLTQQAVYLGLLALLVLALRRVRRSGIILAAGVYAACLGTATGLPRPIVGPEIWQFDVGQGDCALIRFPDGWHGLIDTGPVWQSGTGPLARDVLPLLRRLGVRRLDAVVLTHGHADHTGGNEALAAALPIGIWYGAGRAHAVAAPLHRPAPGDTLHAAGDWSLVCLHPDTAAVADLHENDRSLVLALCHGDSLRGLWSGDLEIAGEAQLSRRLPPVPEAGIDCWKAGHHGSATSGSVALLARVRPRLVVISCGVANRHHHPSHGPYVAAAETLAIMRTDLQGTIYLGWGGDGRLRARPQRPLAPTLARSTGR